MLSLLVNFIFGFFTATTESVKKSMKFYSVVCSEFLFHSLLLCLVHWSKKYNSDLKMSAWECQHKMASLFFFFFCLVGVGDSMWMKSFFAPYFISSLQYFKFWSCHYIPLDVAYCFKLSQIFFTGTRNKSNTSVYQACRHTLCALPDSIGNHGSPSYVILDVSS